MVRDWHEAFERGEDAVMVAKRNVDVEKLNAMAREVRRQAGQLGTDGIEVGEVRFAAGDLVITRVNDRAAAIYNRERWRIAEVDAKKGSAVLEGIDQARTVKIGADYLAQTAPHSEAPALQHAYAVTTYSAQGSTFERAFIMADPSMDKQELYVAASRAREQTFLYVTPEIQAHREEIAPESPCLREGTPHIAEAADRDRAQIAAHEVALRSQFSGLPTEELVVRRDNLRAAAGREVGLEEQRNRLQGRIGRTRDRLDSFEAQREDAQALPRRQRRDELARIDAFEAHGLRALPRLEAEMQEVPAASDVARRELVITERVLSERRELAIIAASVVPPAYIRGELGERSSDPIKRQAWDRGVAHIESYRQQYGITDPGRAFGEEAMRGAERAPQQAAMRQLHEMQRTLGLRQHAVRVRDLGRELGIGP